MRSHIESIVECERLGRYTSLAECSNCAYNRIHKPNEISCEYNCDDKLTIPVLTSIPASAVASVLGLETVGYVRVLARSCISLTNFSKVVVTVPLVDATLEELKAAAAGCENLFPYEWIKSDNELNIKYLAEVKGFKKGNPVIGDEVKVLVLSHINAENTGLHRAGGVAVVDKNGVVLNMDEKGCPLGVI